MNTKQNYGDSFSVTATHGNAAVASKSGVSDKTHYITDIAASSDKAGAILLVKDGTTVIWQVQVATTAAGNNSFSQTFSSPLIGTIGNAVSVEIDGTTACKANIAGFTI